MSISCWRGQAQSILLVVRDLDLQSRDHDQHPRSIPRDARHLGDQTHSADIPRSSSSRRPSPACKATPTHTYCYQHVSRSLFIRRSPNSRKLTLPSRSRRLGSPLSSCPSPSRPRRGCFLLGRRGRSRSSRSEVRLLGIHGFFFFWFVVVVILIELFF